MTRGRHGSRRAANPAMRSGRVIVLDRQLDDAPHASLQDRMQPGCRAAPNIATIRPFTASLPLPHVLASPVLDAA